MTEHTARYEYNMTLQHWRCTCTCGWSYVGELEACEMRFTGHDLKDVWFESQREPQWKQALRIIKGR